MDSVVELELKEKQNQGTVESHDFEDLTYHPDTEDARKDVTSEHTGLGRMVFHGVKGAAGAMVSKLGSIMSEGEKGTKEHRVITKQPVSGDRDPLAMAFDTIEELQRKNSDLTQRLSHFEKEKKCIDLTREITKLESEKHQLQRAVSEKEAIIADEQARVQTLADTKSNACSDLTKALHAKEAELADVNRLFQLEKSRVRELKSKISDRQRELDSYKEKLQHTTPLKSEADEPFTMVEVPSESSVDSKIKEKPCDRHLDSKGCDEIDSKGCAEISTLKEALRKKDLYIANLESQRQEFEKVALTVAQVKDHSRYQSKSLMEVKQKLDATQMSHDELLEYNGSLQHQVDDCENYCRKLEGEISSLQSDKEYLQKALEDTKEHMDKETKTLRDNYAEAMATKRDLGKKLQEALESVDTLTLENKAFTEERVVLKKGIVELQDKLQIAKTEAELYKEDFESERRDREKAHDLKEDMRLACDEKVHAMTAQIKSLQQAHEETILSMTRKLEGVSNEKDRIKQTRELRDTRSSSAKQQIELKDKELHELQHHLFEARQKAIAAQEEVQAKTAQVKQYKKKDDQREEKLQTLEKRNAELMHEMERVRQELVKAKQEYAGLLEEEKSSNSKAMDQVRQELEKTKKKAEHLTKSKKLSKSDAHEELVRFQQDNESLREDNTRLNATLQQVEEQFARMKKSHHDLKKKKNSTVPLASPSGEQRLPSPLTKSNTGPTPTTLVETNAAESPRNPGSTQPNSPFPPPSSQCPDEPSLTRRDLHSGETNIGENQATTKKSTVEDHRPQTLLGVTTPTDGYRSLPSDMDRSAPQHIEADGVHVKRLSPLAQGVVRASTHTHVQSEPHAGQIRGNEGGFNQPPYSSPATRDFAVPEEAASQTDPKNQSLIAGDPPIQKQNFRPGARLEPAGYHAQGLSSFRDQNYHQGNQVQGYNQDDQQMHQPPSQWNSPQARYSDAQAQWPEQGQYYQHDYQQDQRGYQQDQRGYQQPPQPQWQAQNYQEPKAQHRPHNSQWEYTQQGGGEPQQQYWPEERSQQPPRQQYNPNHGPNQPQQRYSNDYPLADNQIHSRPPAYFPGNDLVHDPSNAHAHSPDNRFGVELQSPSSQGTPEKPVPRPRQLNPHQSSRRPEGSTPTPDPPSPENPNSTRLLVEQNALHDNIDEEISEAMAKVSEVTKNEKERAGAPLDPNLVCPMCMKQYRIGEIQLFRVHVNKCDGAKH